MHRQSNYWTTFRKSISQIEKAIVDKYKNAKICATYFGDTPADERQNIIERFQDPKDELRFFIGNQQTGGYGITLTEANTVVYFNNSFDLELRVQSEDRAHRIGQTNKVTYIDLCAEKTIDEKIRKALRAKKNIASEVMGEEFLLNIQTRNLSSSIFSNNCWTKLTFIHCIVSKSG